MKWYYWLIFAFVIFVLIKSKSMFATLSNVLRRLEGFRSVPYWDNKQWSWGFGTEVPDSIANPAIRPNKTITEQQAIDEALAHAQRDKLYLQPKIKRSLTNNQWVALLSFSYNEGTGAAVKLIPEINANTKTLESHWKEYVYSGGVKNPDLVKRRNYEWNLYSSL